jgi:hypothetical protein
MRFLQLNKTNLNLRAVKNVSFAYEYVINSDDRKSYLNKIDSLECVVNRLLCLH